MSRPRWPGGPLALVLCLAGALVGPSAVLAQALASGPVQVAVEPVGTIGVPGIALLTPADGGTAVQVLVMGAPEGISAIIHGGDCELPDASLVALLGDLGPSGQIQTTVPLPLETLADGAHVIAFHPGLDMTTVVGCGVIPAVAATPDAPAATLAPLPAATLAPLPAASAAPPGLEPSEPPLGEPPAVEPVATPAPDPGCLEVGPWIAATEGRLTDISEALSDLNAIAGRYDVSAYLAGLASLDGQLVAMVAAQLQAPVPAAGAELNDRVIEAFETYRDAARQLYDSLTSSVDVTTYARAVARYEEATRLTGDVQRGIGELKGRCPTG